MSFGVGGAHDGVEWLNEELLSDLPRYYWHQIFATYSLVRKKQVNPKPLNKFRYLETVGLLEYYLLFLLRLII